jgi:hypothetical protein
MRLFTLFIIGILASPPLFAQQPQPSSLPGASPSVPDTTVTSDLPVSLDKIRGGLERPASGIFAGRLRQAIDNPANFRIDVEGRRKIEELLATLDFKTGPVPAGGLYAYEQQRIMVPAVDNPLAQPYAAFNQGQLLTILAENLAGKYLAGQVADAITKSVRERAVAAARKEVEDAVAEYCAGKPNSGAGIPLCSPQPPDLAR